MTPLIVRRVAELREEIEAFRRRQPGKQEVGFVPTMGYLHEGHASLIRRSVSENGLTVLSIFVNPLQFGPNEDFERYPRDERRDVELAEASGADIVFIPSVEEMYPEPMRTKVTVSELTDRLCGASRPGHFDGVATVVSKLFHIVQPDRAYFGLKDAQQVAVIARMTRDLHIPVDIVPCPTVREADGLALSSRNVYLSPEERKQALVLSQSLAQVPGWIEDGMTEAELAVRIRGRIRSQPLADIDYVEIATYPDLTQPPAERPLRESEVPLLVALAVRFGKTRLIDNVLLFPSEVK
ncbi:pantoate--beta-alanine ligase [Cohnella sp. CFH 77786]|uniref:pantoate--beta-alanine ligase n=1 Tax=Cohnella sp. CFH 77786 TaxID=2662265 RepID=UPI001C6103ED|nr:pantoate--beta-alanine ligase [Cohnella sp. CFH 77786]MBW5446602.1 pantoate--beta-alanine ligase [Cohnella sp. CFH 77786]